VHANLWRVAPLAPLSSIDAAVLRALPRDIGPGLWLTPLGISVKLGVAEDVARSCLRRHRGRGLAVDDGERPQAFGRTSAGDVALEHQPGPDASSGGSDSL
jgi:hypothetical protein